MLPTVALYSALFLAASAWFAGLGEWLLSVPLATWAKVVGFLAFACASAWAAWSRGLPALKVRKLRAVADLAERLVVVPLRRIAPRTATAVDDTGLLFAEMLVRALREAADAASSAAPSIPSPADVAEKLVASMPSSPQVVRLTEPPSRG